MKHTMNTNILFFHYVQILTLLSYTNQYIQILILKVNFLTETQIDIESFLSWFLTEQGQDDFCVNLYLLEFMVGNIFKILLQHCWSNCILQKEVRNVSPTLYCNMQYWKVAAMLLQVSVLYGNETSESRNNILKNFINRRR